MQDPTPYAALSVAEQEALIDLITSLRGGLHCSKDAEQAIAQKLGIEPPDAHSVLDHLLQQKRIEARTAPGTEVTPHFAEEPSASSEPHIKLFRTGQRKTG